jgi:predicted nucleic acid-binding protein
VIQEILHRFAAIGRRNLGSSIATDALDLFAPILPVTHAVMRRVPELVIRFPTLATRDFVHVATCLELGIATVVSPVVGSTWFSLFAEIDRAAPPA